MLVLSSGGSIGTAMREHADSWTISLSERPGETNVGAGWQPAADWQSARPDSYSRLPPLAANGVIPLAASDRLNGGTSLSINVRYSALAAARSFSIISVKLNAVSVGFSSAPP